jgi:HSP20 family protein
VPARWRRMTTRAVRVVSYAGPAPWELLSVVSTRPIVGPTAWRPAADVCETADSVVVTVELAGVVEDDLEIEAYPDALILDGFRAASGCGPEAVYHSLQIRHGSFHVELPLPAPIDPGRGDALLDNGMLRISLPKLDDGRPEPGPEPR